MLQMKVSTALPAALVRLAVGAEVAIAPRPRRTLAQQHALESSDVQAAADATTDEVADHPDTCLRLQACTATVLSALCVQMQEIAVCF